MERPSKQKSMLLKLLPKLASAVSFQNAPFSPGRDHHRSSTKLKSHAYKGFSGPINYGVLPEEARRKPKTSDDGSGFEANEPTSPKVSCMGQIKYKHKKNKNKSKKIMNEDKYAPSKSCDHDHHKENKSKQAKKASSAISKLFSRPASRKMNGSKCGDHDKEGRVAAMDNIDRAPALGQMKRFASGRDTLANFDWTAQIAPIDHDRDCFSDGEGGRDHDSDDDHYQYEGGEREVIIPHSAPMLLGGKGGGLGFELEPRKEVNLWKRRTMAPPPPLSLNSKVR